MEHRRELVEFVQNNAESMAARWLDIVRRHSATPTYHNWEEQDLIPRAVEVYRHLCDSIPKPTMKKPIAETYLALGRHRCREGFDASEVVQALIVTRRVLWFKVQKEHFIEKKLDFDSTVDLYNRVLLFFDRAIYYMSKGYEEAAREKS